MTKKTSSLFVVTIVAVLGIARGAAGQDVGDAPAPYPICQHDACDESLGAACTSVDVVNPETPAWTGSADDDGVIVTNLIKGSSATITLDVRAWYAEDDLAVWIDWNNDGDWIDAGEQVIWAGVSTAAPDGTIAAGLNAFSVPVPAGAVGAAAPLRARLWWTSGPGDPQFGLDLGGSPDGTTNWGEVEDHLVPYLVVGDPEIDVQRPAGNSILNGGVDNLGALQFGVTAPFTWTIENLGASNPLNITGASISSLVNCTAAITSMPGSPVAPGGTTTLAIDVTPTAVGPFSFDITISNNDADEASYVVNVTGLGQDFMSGIYLISNDATEAPDFPDLGAAFDALEVNPLGGPVIFEISEGIGPYTSTAAYKLGDVGTDVSAANPLTIRAQAGENPVIDGSGAAGTAFFGEFGTLSIFETPYVTIEGLELTGGVDFGLGIIDEGSNLSNDIAVLGCRIHGITAGNGIWVVGNGVSIENVTITNNMIWDVAIANASFAGQCGGPCGEAALGFFNVGLGTVIQHNTFVVNTGQTGGMAVRHSGTGESMDDFSYNIVMSASPNFGVLEQDSVDCFDSGGGTIPCFPKAADHNVYFLTGGATAFSPTYATLGDYQTASGLDANSVDTDPALVSIVPASEDLHLTLASTNSIDAAVGSTVGVDIDGDARPIGGEADIGADEASLNEPPTIGVMSGATTVNDSDVLVVTQGDTVASLNLALTVSDADAGDTLDLLATVTDSSDITGFIQAEWDATGTGGSIVASPAAGTFDTVGSITVDLAADDNAGGADAFTFTIQVLLAPADPGVSVTAGGAPVGDGDTLNVNFGDTVASANLVFTVTDANVGDTLDLVTTVTNSADITGFVQAEWDATGTGGSIMTAPATGSFDTVGAITVALAADDNTGRTDALSFTIQVLPPPTAPVISVTASGAAVGDGDTVTLDFGETVVGANLVFTVTDDNVGDTLDLTATVTDSADITGFVQAEWNATGTGGSITATPATGSFDTAGNISVTLVADDNTGRMDVFILTIRVLPPPSDPVISVTAGGASVGDGDTVTFDYGSTVAAANLVFSVTDPDTGDTLDLATTVTNSADITGFVQAEWNATGTGGSIVATPATGSFDAAGTITVVLAADDNTGRTDALTFTIQVLPAPADPVISVTAGGAAVGDGDTLTFNFGETVAGANLVFTVSDDNVGDALDLVATVTNSADITGFVQAEWDASGTGGSIVATPASGSFDTAGTITVALAADDNTGRTDALSFTIQVLPPPADPVISVTAGGAAVGDGDTLALDYGSTVAGAGLVFTVTDADTGDTLDLVATVTDSADITGFVQAEWDATGTGGSIMTAPATGLFDTAGTITVALSADDNTGLTDTFSFSIEVLPEPTAPVISVTAGGAAVGDGDTLTLNFGDTVAAADLVFTVTDADVGDTLDLVTVVTNSLDITGFWQAEWDATGTGGSIVATPASGSFDMASTITVALAADDNTGRIDTLTFSIEVLPQPADPVISVTADGATLNDGGTLALSVGDTVAGANLVFTVTDADTGDTLNLVATVTDSTGITGFVQTEWDATGTGGSISATPASGSFETAGTITVALAADDSTGRTDALSFTIQVLAPSGDPVLSVTADGAALNDGDTLALNVGDTVAGANLVFTVTDADTGDTLDLVATVTDSLDITGFVQAEWDASGTGGSTTATPATGSFDTAGTITVALAADDNTGGSSTLTFQIAVNATGNNPPVLEAPAATGGITISGSSPNFNGTVAIDGGLGLDFTATDADPADSLSFSVSVTGGTLTASEAGLAETFPYEPSGGVSPQTISLSGTAAVAGTIELTVTVTDGNGGTDSYTISIGISDGGGNGGTADGCGCITNAGSNRIPGATLIILLVFGLGMVCRRRR